MTTARAVLWQTTDADMSSTTLAVVHKLGLPENAKYRDTGCSLHSSCLTCPFDKCRYDMTEDEAKAIARAQRRGTNYIEERMEGRRKRALDLRAKGLKVNDIARTLHCARRTVFRLTR